jgi:hypothetical protein
MRWQISLQVTQQALTPDIPDALYAAFRATDPAAADPQKLQFHPYSAPAAFASEPPSHSSWSTCQRQLKTDHQRRHLKIEAHSIAVGEALAAELRALLAAREPCGAVSATLLRSLVLGEKMMPAGARQQFS